VTRFVALATIGNTDKEKYLYAFNINPGEEAEKVPEDCTESPFPDEAMAKHKGTVINYHFNSTKTGIKFRKKIRKIIVK